MELRFEVDGVVEFHRKFQRYTDAVEDLRPAWQRVTNAFRKIQLEQFNSEGASGRGGAWKPISAVYAARKQAIYGSNKILVASGRLKDSLTKQTADTVLREDKDSYQIGTSVPYAGYHQTGTARLPQRKVIDFSDEQRRYLTKEMQRGLLLAMKVENTFR